MRHYYSFVLVLLALGTSAGCSKEASVGFTASAITQSSVTRGAVRQAISTVLFGHSQTNICFNSSGPSGTVISGSTAYSQLTGNGYGSSTSVDSTASGYLSALSGSSPPKAVSVVDSSSNHYIFVPSDTGDHGIMFPLFDVPEGETCACCTNSTGATGDGCTCTSEEICACVPIPGSPAVSCTSACGTCHPGNFDYTSYCSDPVPFQDTALFSTLTVSATL